MAGGFLFSNLPFGLSLFLWSASYCMLLKATHWVPGGVCGATGHQAGASLGRGVCWQGGNTPLHGTARAGHGRALGLSVRATRCTGGDGVGIARQAKSGPCSSCVRLLEEAPPQQPTRSPL